MAECSLSPVIFKLAALHQLSGQYWRTYDQAFVKDAINQLEVHRHLLRLADSTEDGDLDLEVWTMEVVNMALKLEDVVDENMIHLLSQSVNGLLAYPKKFVHSIRKMEAQHKIVTALQRFTFSIKVIHRRKCLNFDTNGCVQHVSVIWEPEHQSFIRNGTEDLVGIDGPKEWLINSLISDEDALQVIPVVGMGGMGKTTLAKTVYGNPEIKKHFQVHGWVNISQVFQVNNLLENLIEQLYGVKKHMIPQEVTSFELKKKVNEHLKKNRYFIVIDDLWSIEAWNAIKHAFPDNNCGSRILITTRNADVAYTSCISQMHIYNLNPLTMEESWYLFCKKTFNGGTCPEHLIDASRRILKRCFGNPLAIVVISGVLRPKVKAGVVGDWEDVYNNGIGSKLYDKWTSPSTFKILLLSYNDLPHYLKSCYIYLSVFPKDQLIERTRLIRLWIAEGLVEEKKGIKPEDVADSYLTKLLNRNFIQVAERKSDGRIKTFRVHDLMKAIIRMKSRDQNFVAIAQERDVLWSEKVRRLSIRYNLPQIQKSQTHGIRSFLMFEVKGRLTMSSVNTMFSGAFKLLAVLDLKGAAIEEFPTAIVKLFHLRYLNLRDTKIKSIPNSIGKLQVLETLDIKGTAVCKLPNGILKLQRLRNLLVYRSELEANATFSTKHGFEAPKRIGNLISLQNLCNVKAGEGRDACFRMRELGKLTQLRRLGVSQLKKENNKDLCSSLENLTNLEALSISCLEGETMDLQHLTSPPESLQRLYLTGQLEAIPNWFISLPNLVKVFLKSSKLIDDPVKILENLPNLAHVELLQAYNGSQLFFKADTFQKLKRLGLHKFISLEQVTVEKNAICNLETLVLQDCQLLKTAPVGIEHLSKLQRLDLIDMPRELINMISEDTTKIKHIPEVNLTNKVMDDAWKIMRLSASIRETDPPTKPSIKIKHIPEVNLTNKVMDDDWKTMRLSGSIKETDELTKPREMEISSERGDFF
ncbi:unnamed protein product [Rhodiola kirilowii]